MKGKTHPLSIIFGIVLIVFGVLAIHLAFLRFETLIRDFSYVLLNIFLVCNIFGLTFIWVGLTKFSSISLTNDTLIKKYCFGLVKKKLSLKKDSYYSIHVNSYFSFKRYHIIIETQTQEQIQFSNFSIWNFKQIQNYTEAKLKNKEIKFRINQTDKILIYSYFSLFVWLILASIFNLTF